MMAFWLANWSQDVGASVVRLRWPVATFMALLCLGSLQSLAASQSCSGRVVLTAPSGVITDGQGDYPPSAHCEWLIQGNPGQYIMLNFVSMHTECAYDYLFIYDGNSYNSPLLGTFSGRTIPDRVLAQSGKMLIYFFSDRNYVLTGFYALYNVTNCPYGCSGNGLCNNETHTCLCDQGYTGVGCDSQLCPNLCSGNTHGVCDYTSYICRCSAGWYGHDCGLPVNRSTNESGWHIVLPSSPTFQPRAGHAGAFVQSSNCLYVFGGNSLNELFDDLAFYCFGARISNAWSAVTRSNPWPAARHAHAMTAIGDVLYMFGGILEDGEHANDLWMFDTHSHHWTPMAVFSDVRPIAVAGHTLTAVDDAYLYLFGGRTSGGQFLSDMYRIGVDGAGDWERVKTRGGKESELHLVGHSTVFHRESRSLIVFGGFMTDNARFPKRKNALHTFHVDEHWWSELGFNALLPNAPRKRAFHQAVIVDNYMVIHGGNIHVHHDVETCYDDQLHFYHLGCHTWIDIKTMSRAFGESESEPMKGRYGHVAAAAFGNTILIAGGYRGSVLGDHVAYTVPLGIAKSLDDVRFRNSSDHCFLYRSSEFCQVDPECVWCSSGSSSACLHRDNPESCGSGSIQPSNCPGICESLHSCDACVVQGQGAVIYNSTVKGLKQKERCTWCVKEGLCHAESDHRGICNNSRSTASGLEGWWTGLSAAVTTLDRCWSEDYPAGLHWIKYRSPVNWTLPDEVNIVRNSSMSFQFNSMFDAENVENTQYIALYRGFVYPLGAPKADSNLKMYLVTSAATAVIYMSDNSNPANKEKLAEVDMATYNVEQVKRPNQAPIFPDERRGFKYYIEERVTQAVAGLANTQVASTMNLEWTGALVTPKRQRQSFTSEFLEPFNSNGVSCLDYNTCLACMTDTSCGWCVDSCIARNESEKSLCRTTLGHPALVLNASHCSVCTDFVECSTCLEDEFCEWLTPEARCVRRGRFDWAVTNASNCPVNCLSRNTSAWCISDKNECAWCEQSQLCFAFVEYVLRYPYGSCNEWVDSLSIDPIEDCRLLTSCEPCLGRYMCGWCGNVDNPTVGVCHRGDFSGVNSTTNCSHLISDKHGLPSIEPALWSYEECPDVDECRHGMSSCHANASCINTHGSFNCLCNRGFAGDAVHNCNRTCYHACIHGHCSGPPDYECSCDVGWTGDNCSVDCGCNNHSTCDVAIGQCDDCQHNTIGPTCDRCVPGSYGNPKSVAGCHLCDCNGHGDSLLGVCDNSSGVCYCTDNTVGNKCENCSKDHYGNPRNGGHCYRMCDGRTIITRATSGALGSHRGGGTEGGHVFCLWILTVHEDLDNALGPQNTPPTGSLQAVPSIGFTIGTDMQILCSQDYVFVYDGIPSFPGFLVGSRQETDAQLLAAICGQNLDRGITVLATSGSMTVFFEAIVGSAHVTRGFNATYHVHTCAEECRDLCTVDTDRCVNGIAKCDPTLCTGNRTCVGDVCECRDGLTGPDCSVELCPFNCSSGTGQGFCLEEQDRCVCNPGFGGLGCSESLGPTRIVYTPVLGPRQLNRTQNRIGHSLISCDDGTLYLFGGYAPGVGLLNDLWKYDPGREEWTLLKPATNEEPDQRYYHAGVCIPNVHAFYIFGGIVARVGPTQDLWRYNLDSGRWNKLKVSENNGSSPPMPMAGHTMTLVDDIKVWVVGGFSSSSYFSESVFIYDAGSNRWTELADVPGARPTGLYGHSTVFHPPSQALYVFGGYVYSVDSASVSNVLYALDLKNRSASIGNVSWTVLPAVNGNQPPERFFHGAAQTEHFLVIAGGYSSQLSPETSVYVYRFYCNQWMNISPTDVVMRDLHMTSAIGPLAASASGDVYTMGLSSRIPGQVLLRMTIPGDICGLFTDVHSCLSSNGCNACSVKETKQFFCYSNAGPRPQGCMVQNTSVAMQSGVVCDVRRLENVECQQFKTCSECLARWPIFPHGGPKACQWCSNCPVGQCIPESADCDKVSPCNRQQRHIHDAKDCLERVCQASNCDSCWGNPRCMWTRHIKRSRETDKSLSLIAMYDWNCISNIPLNVSSSGSFLPETSPPLECPTRCYVFATCGDCLRSTGAEGGAQSCVWSMQLSKCYPPSYLPLGCSVGQCGLIITQNVSSCPSRCSAQTTCASCLQTPHCGWCAINGLANGGQGVCMEGGLLGPVYGQCSVGNVSLGPSEPLPRPVLDWLAASTVPPTWSFTSCPLEDECRNGHSKCDTVKEKCINQVNGYTCECQNGFIMNESKRTCEPFCRQGCLSGSCVMPNTCRCNFGFVGANCSTECQCNKHSDCKSVVETNVCLACQNNTKGKNCSECQFLFVGNPENGGRCNSCFDLCNQHSPVCLAKGYFSSSAENLTNLITNENAKTLFAGPKSAADTVCWNCSNNTQGSLCQECRNGYFRLKDRPLTESCQICECNGHSDICDKEKGDNCDCKNNTKSPRCDSSDALKSCYKLQCSQCIDNFLGTPTDGHQCYRQMTVDREMCFDPITQMNCNPNREPNPLLINRTIFFAVQPRFQNVDIRLFLDVTKGGLDLYFSPLDNTYKVSVDPSTGVHVVSIDPIHKYSRIYGDLSTTDPKDRRRRAEPRDFFVTVAPSAVTAAATEMASPASNKTINPDNSVIDKTYFLDERTASGPVTFISIAHNETFLIVRGIRNRLVLKLLNTVHDLKTSRFYLVLFGVGSDESALTSGLLYYRQDQPHIDLFVFFSVFFSCFFLFLAICVIVWKTKQMIDLQRTRHRRQLEMAHMASRPFARSLVLFDAYPSCVVTPLVIPRRRVTKTNSKYSLATSAHGNSVHPTQAKFHINPLALEPTCDGTAVVSTFMFQLPGGDAAPVRACLGSVLVSTRIMYPNLHHSLPKGSARSRQGVST